MQPMRETDFSVAKMIGDRMASKAEFPSPFLGANVLEAEETKVYSSCTA
jgi:hypothetical protein